MATYAYTYYATVQFTGNGNNFGVSTPTASTGTLSDGEGNTTFEGADTITGGFGGTYMGTITDTSGHGSGPAAAPITCMAPPRRWALTLVRRRTRPTFTARPPPLPSASPPAR